MEKVKAFFVPCVIVFLIILYETALGDFKVQNMWQTTIPELILGTTFFYFLWPAIWKDKIVEGWEQFVPALCGGIFFTYVWMLKGMNTGFATLFVFLVGIFLTGAALVVNYARK